MPSALTTQTEREIRYEHRLHKKRVDQQTVDRSVRLSNRSNAISDEVSKEIVSIQGKKKDHLMTRSASSGLYFSTYS
jgi:hypothetical protein